MLAAAALCSYPLYADEAATETFGATSPDELGPIGGGQGYRNIVTSGDYTVGTEDELVDALAKAQPGQVVYVKDDAELDFTVRVRAQEFVLQLPGGVTLASGRGNDGSQGALIYSDEFKTSPLIRVTGPNARITGLRLRGPDSKMRWTELPRLSQMGGSELYYKFPTSDGIRCTHPGLEVDNCEISAWGHGGMYLLDDAEKAHVHHNYIHHCRRRGLGYGVSLNGVEALIESNIFDYCRHSVAATGAPGTAYEARNNIIEENGVLSSFDMHGGSDRGDGTNIAGDWIKIHHNTCKGLWKGSLGDQEGGCVPAFGIRGVPTQGGEIHHNWFCNPDPAKAYFKAADDDVRVYRNQYGPDREVKD